MSRPLVLIIERRTAKEIDGRKLSCPSGIPTLTEMREMHWWELLSYKLRMMFKRKRHISTYHYTPCSLSAGVELSPEQYALLLNRDPNTISAVRYLDGKISLDILTPSALNTSVDDKDLEV